MIELPLANELEHRAHHILDGNVRVDARILEEVESLGSPQVFENPVDTLANVLLTGECLSSGKRNDEG